jgi:predicted amidophosphoribosyltransferase
MLREIAQLIWPLNCAGCGVVDWSVCPQCLALLNVPASEVSDLVESTFPIYSIHSYQGAVRNLVLAFKNLGRADLDNFFRGLMLRDCARLAKDQGPELAGVKRLLVVPAPSSARAIRERGRQTTNVLAKGVVEGLQTYFPNSRIELMELLRQTTSVKQEGLTYRQRTVNKAGSVSPTRAAQQLIGAGRQLISKRNFDRTRVILVDDILTTGATLRECVTVLNQLGLQVSAALVIAKS